MTDLAPTDRDKCEWAFFGPKSRKCNDGGCQLALAVILRFSSWPALYRFSLRSSLRREFRGETTITDTKSKPGEEFEGAQNEESQP